jgi:hypothetical protein
MRISAQLTMVMAAIMALLCFGVAITGFTSLGEITDPEVLSDARGFALFWAFLGIIAVVFGLASWWIVRTGRKD